MSYTTEREALDAAMCDVLAEGGYITFEGDNCADVEEHMGKSCAGWDGVSRRCDCGNRRVSWATGKNDGTWYCYAEAY